MVSIEMHYGTIQFVVLAWVIYIFDSIAVEQPVKFRMAMLNNLFCKLAKWLHLLLNELWYVTCHYVYFGGSGYVKSIVSCSEIFYFVQVSFI